MVAYLFTCPTHPTDLAPGGYVGGTLVPLEVFQFHACLPQLSDLLPLQIYLLLCFNRVHTLQHFWPWPDALLTIKPVTSVTTLLKLNPRRKKNLKFVIKTIGKTFLLKLKALEVSLQIVFRIVYSKSFSNSVWIVIRIVYSKSCSNNLFE